MTCSLAAVVEQSLRTEGVRGSATRVVGVTSGNSPCEPLGMPDTAIEVVGARPRLLEVAHAAARRRRPCATACLQPAERGVSELHGAGARRGIAIVVLSNTARSVDRLGFALVENIARDAAGPRTR